MRSDPPPDSADQRRYAEFVRLWLEHESAVRCFLRLLLDSWADVDDAFQDASLVAWQKFDQFQPGTSFRNWLLTIARFKALDLRRSRLRTEMVFSDEVLAVIAEEGVAVTDELERERQCLDQCLEQLPEPQRQLLSVCYRSGGKLHEAATASGKSVAAIYKSIQRLRAALLDCIQRRLEAHPI
jgi:RNA polymerase sigma-70 factor, ECF subfamily